MSSYHNTDITHAIQNTLKCIPVVWPLQQFVSTNPCWDAIDAPIETVAAHLNGMGHTPFCMPLSQYWAHYQQGAISTQSLKRTTQQFLCNTLPKEAMASLGHANPLYDFMTNLECHEQLIKTHHTQDSAAILCSSQVQPHAYDNILELTQAHCLNWLSAYFNPTSFQMNIIDRLEPNMPSLWQLWRSMMSEKGPTWKALLCHDTPDLNGFIAHLLRALEVPQSCLYRYIFAICWQLKGWIGFLKWQEQHPHNPYCHRSASAQEVIVMWLCYEHHWLKTHHKTLARAHFTLRYDPPSTNPDANTPWLDYLAKKPLPSVLSTLTVGVPQVSWLWQEAFEITYGAPVYKQLLQQKQQPPTPPEHHRLAQWVFCIDVRSEGLRRHIEQCLGHETFGFAGFFGFAFALTQHHKQKTTHQCPALMTPSMHIEGVRAAQSYCGTIQKSLNQTIRETKKSIFALFALYEILGFWFVLLLTCKNYCSVLLHRLQSLCVRAPAPVYKHHIPTDQLLNAALGLLKGMGLTHDFAAWVVICGHSATTENNPYQAALDCGACGGNSGMSNAVVACQVLNDPNIRSALINHGICIPETTRFIAACHNTTTDHIHWVDDTQPISNDQKQALDAIKNTATTASSQLQAERRQSLPGDPNLLRRSTHWAELIPEWGLANNAAMVIGPRTLTQALHLDRRVFLHSYVSEQDPDGSILTRILLGPMIVAHWINCQYYFSAVNPDQYGSGNKAIHNVLDRVGVIEGNQSDLKYGLTWQSVYYQSTCMHQPQRLFVFIDATPQKIQAILDQHPVLQSLVSGRWLFIHSLDPASPHLLDTLEENNT